MGVGVVGARVTYANVVSTLALVVALGVGTAWAAPKITGKQIRDGSLTGADLRDGSVGSRDIANNSISGADLRAGSVGAADLGAGAVTGDKVGDGTLTGADIGDGSVGAGDLAGGLAPGSTLAAGTTIRGAWNASFTSDLGGAAQTAQAWSSITFAGHTISGGLTMHLRLQAATPTAECPGTTTLPEAASGHVCIYITSSQNVTEFTLRGSSATTTMTVDGVSGNELSSPGLKSSPYGIVIKTDTTVASNIMTAYGNWAATA